MSKREFIVQSVPTSSLSDIGLYSTGEIARLMGVNATTIWRAVKKKKIKAVRTPGGHSRIPGRAAKKFFKKAGFSGEHIGHAA